jgi:maltooligosyltrehalose trehalohydrolase
MEVGAVYKGDGKCEFTVWAPLKNKISVEIISGNPRSLAMNKDDLGYWKAVGDEISKGDRYMYNIEDQVKRPDPASFYQPDGVHEPSAIVDHNSFPWDDKSFRRCGLSEMIIYEMHVGTFSVSGTFYDVIPRIKDLVNLGINAIEIMPVAQFPGKKNWGYDGTYLFSVQDSYGGPDGLKELVNEAHAHGLSVILDVVYNHLGPEGNYTQDFGPYFTGQYRSPWGSAINFDGRYSLGVRNFFIENALYWFKYYHIDGLRLDAVHGIYDFSAKHFMLELQQRVTQYNQKNGKHHFLIAESDLNDVRIIQPEDIGGYGLDAQWLDDYHHCIHTLLTKESQGYYADFGSIEDLKQSFCEGFVYQGQYSKYRESQHGSCSKHISPDKFVVFSQNHDQIGNRAQGRRLASLVSFDALKLTAAAIILSPYIPLLFMGQEYAEDAPFLYFIDHEDKDLVEAVRKGRQAEFAAFKWQTEIPDPKDDQTFARSKLNWEKRDQDKHKVILQLYKHLIRIRKNSVVFSKTDRRSLDACLIENSKLLLWRRWYNRTELFCVMNFDDQDVEFKSAISQGKWKKILDSQDRLWQGGSQPMPDFIQSNQQLKVSALSFALYEKEVLR